MRRHLRVEGSRRGAASLCAPSSLPSTFFIIIVVLVLDEKRRGADFSDGYARYVPFSTLNGKNRSPLGTETEVIKRPYIIRAGRASPADGRHRRVPPCGYTGRPRLISLAANTSRPIAGEPGDAAALVGVPNFQTIAGRCHRLHRNASISDLRIVANLLITVT